MAIYNEILVARYARMLQKLFGTKGTVPAKQLAGELMAVMPVFNGVENRYLEGWDRFAVPLGVTGGAAQNGAIAFRNPAGSNVLAVVEQIIIGSTVAKNVSVQRNVTADLTTVVGLAGNRVPDTRQRPNPALIASSSVNATGTGFSMFSIQTVANQSFRVIANSNHEIPILPGDGIQLFDNTQAAQMNISLLWRERFLEESERS